MLTITIHDTNTERYTYTASANVLGRRYDNIAEYLTVIKPESETGRDCIMIVTYGDTVVDHIPVGDTPIAITSNLSQYASVKIGFAFLGADGYIKNSEVKQFFFLTAQKPDGFVPLPPEQKTTIDYLISHGFTGAKLENNILSFTNAAGGAVAEIKLSGFIQEQADWNETNAEAETYIKNKPTKLSDFTDDLGAYVKPSNGIPETDLSADVQAKLNSGGGAKNLLRGDVTVGDFDIGDAKGSNVGYPLGIEVGKKYNITATVNGKEYTVMGDGVDKEGTTLLANASSPELFIELADFRFIGYDKASFTVGNYGPLPDDNNSLFMVMGEGYKTATIIVKSITEYTEVVADKVKNPLKITVNGEEKTYNGSEAVEVDINTGSNYKIKQVSVTEGETMSSVVGKITSAIEEELTAQSRSSAVVTVALNDLTISDAVMSGNATGRVFLETSYMSATSGVSHNKIVFTTPLVRAVGDTSSVWGSGNWAVAVQFGKTNSNIFISTGGGIGGNGADFKDLSNFVSDKDTTIDIIFY